MSNSTTNCVSHCSGQLLQLAVLYSVSPTKVVVSPTCGVFKHWLVTSRQFTGSADSLLGAGRCFSKGSGPRACSHRLFRVLLIAEIMNAPTGSIESSDTITSFQIAGLAATMRSGDVSLCLLSMSTTAILVRNIRPWFHKHSKSTASSST